MKMTKKWLAAAGAALMAVSVLLAPGVKEVKAAAEKPVVETSIANVSARIGEEFTIPISFSSESDLRGALGKLNDENGALYDSKSLEYLGASTSVGGTVSIAGGNFGFITTSAFKSGTIDLKFKLLQDPGEDLKVTVKDLYFSTADADSEKTTLVSTVSVRRGPGLAFVKGIPYVYDESGDLIHGATPVINGKKYYVNEDGIAQSGWLRLADWQMYFDPETYEAAIGITHVDGKAYLFDNNGVEILRSRTEVIDGKKYWFQPDGSLMSGWCKLGDWTMYYDPETYVGATGLTMIDGKPYVFDENGVLIKNNTPVINGKKYYVNDEGVAQSGWLRLANWQMYFDPETYEAATGITHVDGKAYLFDENGVEILRSRTEVINGKKYWFQPDGSLMSGWCKLGDWTMYYDPETYVAVTGTVTIDGVQYTFDANGVLIK